AYHMIPVKRIADLFEDMTTYRPSEATVLSLLQTSYEVLEPIETTIAEKLLQQVVVHADETGCRADGKLNWVHVCSDGGYTYLRVHEKRGEEAFKAIGFLPEYQGTVVHDCMKSYFKEGCAFSDALCNAHLLRESLGIAKHDGHRWASRMAELLREGWKAALAARAKEENVEPEVIQVFEDRYDAILREGEKEWALEEASTPVSKKGKQKKSKAGNLGERFMLHKEAILLFLRRPEIPFDNNQAERDLRMVKVKQKVSGAFRTQAGA
ncbi:IS66 family transposase, partial [Cohnella fermenti]